jgi:hypothetical protein
VLNIVRKKEKKSPKKIFKKLLQLDSVKWYKDSQEFYRENLRPELANRNMIFNSPGVKVCQRELIRNKGMPKRINQK